MTNKYNHQIANGFKAIAPYNFVPLPERVFVAPSEEQKNVNDRYHADRHTGYLVLKIKTETPLYTRCAYPPAVPVEEDGKPKVTRVRDCQDFFHHGKTEEPVIPGSSLRGLARALVEILAYAKMVNIDGDKQMIHRSVGDQTTLGNDYRKRIVGDNKRTRPQMGFEYPLSSVRGGYLVKRNGKYSIRPAQTDPATGENFVHVEYRDITSVGWMAPPTNNVPYVEDCYVSPAARSWSRRSNPNLELNIATTSNVSKTPQPGLRKATLVVSGHMDGFIKKHLNYAIYEPDMCAPLLEISQEQWSLYESDRDMKRGAITQTRRLENSDDPLFYLVDTGGDLVFFGTTMMIRLPYPHKVSDFIPTNLKGSELDLTETMFGRVRQNTSDTRAGRVFFTDAVWINRNEYPFLKNNENDDGRRVPKILASPKPTSFQLYLNQPEVITKQNNQKQDGSTLKSYYDKGATLIRGTKLYWSKKSLTEQQHCEEFTQNSDSNLPRTQITANGVQIEGEEGRGQDSSQHTIIRPVTSGIEFESRVYFENLTNLELGVLLTALELPSSKRHRLGMGKPLGLGTIEIKMEVSLQNRNPCKDSSPKSRYELLFDGDENWHTAERSDSRTVADECTKAFRQKMLEHHNSAVSDPQVDPTKDDLMEIPRLKALFDLLEWDNPVEGSHTRYLDPNNPDDRDIIRQRYVLPNPQNFLARSAAYRYEIQVNEENVVAEINSDFNDEDVRPTPQMSDTQTAEDVKRRVKGLRGAGDVILVSSITQKIESISNSIIKLELAQALKSWLVQNKLWDKPTHLEKRQSLEKILGES